MRIYMDNLKAILMVCLVVFAALVYFSGFSRHSVTNPSQFVVATQMPSVKTIESATAVATDTNSKNYVANVVPIQDPLRDPVLRKEIVDWYTRRGTFAYETDWNAPEGLRNIYEGYDEDVLRQLGDGGDLRALWVLARRADTSDARRPLHEKAAVYDSTWALGEIGLGFSTRGLLSAKSPEERKSMYMEALAYYKAAELRGDWTHSMRWGRDLLKSPDVVYTKEDEMQIQQRAQEIYDDLQSKRYALGLGDFDNSIPEAVMRDYEATLQSLSAIDRNP